MTYRELKNTEAYLLADVLEVYDDNGREIDIEWLENHMDSIISYRL